MAVSAVPLMDEAEPEQESRRCKLFCASAIKGICFLLDIAAFLYALYATSLFFFVVLMWVFSILITIYVSISSGQTWAQLFAVGLGLPLIGPIVNVLDESFVAVVRTLRVGFQSKRRQYVLAFIVLPMNFPDEIVTKKRWHDSMETASVGSFEDIVNPVERYFDKFTQLLHKIPPRMLSIQQKLTLIFLIADLIATIVFFSREVNTGFAARAFFCLFVMLLCACIRFFRSCPTTLTDLEERLFTSNSLRFVKYCIIGAAFFILSSTTASAIWTDRPDIYRFTLSAFACYFAVLTAIFVVVVFVCPTVIRIFPGMNVADEDAPGSSNNNRLPEDKKELQLLSVNSKSTVVLISSLVFIVLVFIAMFIARGVGAGHFDDNAVSTRNRWGALVGWVVITLVSLIHTIGDKEHEPKNPEQTRLQRNHSEVSLLTTENTYSPPPRPGHEETTEPTVPTVTWAPTDIQADAVITTPRKVKSIMAVNVTKKSARFFVLTITTLFFLVVGLMTSMNFASTLPPINRSYDYSVLDDRKPSYTICSSHWGSGNRFNVTDLILIAKAAYYDNAAQADQALRLWFNEPLNTTESSYIIQTNTSLVPEVGGVHAYHIVFYATNRTTAASLPAGVTPEEWQITNTVSLPRIDVVAVRGSHNGLDWLQDAYVWGDSIFFSLFDKLSPFSLPSSVVGSLVQWSKNLRYGVFGDISYYRQLKALTTAVIEDAKANGGGEVMIVGHSLGGGLAQLVGSALGIDAFAVSGVGVGYQASAAGFTIDEVRGYQSNIVPASDLVPEVDMQIGNVQNVACSASPNPGTCHSLATTWTEMARSCSDIRSATDREGRPSAVVGQAVTQGVIWLVCFIVMAIGYQVRVAGIVIRGFNLVEKRTINQNVQHS